ncbi:MAG TPA: RtcB family protein [Thermomicrobiales bacterium]|jgi:tRNA-splicing ligase RtcB|nr:RtcB family protein [Thermomicrobiales bacterium]
MVVVIETPETGVPIRSWLPREEIEKGAWEQLVNVSNHPEIGSHVAVMPDCHVGYGVPIGCVAPTIGSVIPNAVGVDIGCGLHAIQTGIAYDRERMDQRFWREWASHVAREVPTGFASHKAPQKLGPLDRKLRATDLQRLLKEKAAFQLGTLGGGNHFLEAQVDEVGEIWLMVHSGSRNTGLRIANHYNGLAVDLTTRRRLVVGKDLASLPLDHEWGQDYLHDMQWATDFALANRKEMGQKLLRWLWRTMEAHRMPVTHDAPLQVINIHHNFARLEEHGGQQVMVHRKGATSAAKGEMGVIPGSMGTPSFIVRGLGNPDSFESCSHGAGRVMGRNVARKSITAKAFAESLAGTFSKASMSYVDEAPLAYKDVEMVVDRQRDLVEVVHTLRPLMTVKGDSKARED